MLELWLCRYLIIINLIAIIVCCFDKFAARKNFWRVREKVLFAISFFGGAALMYVTMLIIRHKTLHKRFMIGLPLIIAFHVFLLLMFLTRT